MLSKNEGQERRAHTLLRAFQRELGRKPTEIQKTLMVRAARLTCVAELALLDSSVTPNDKVRLDHAAGRAREEMRGAFEQRGASSLQELLAAG